jgi:ornithine cyclodeaminase
MNFPFSVIAGRTVHRLVHGNVPEVIEVVKRGYIAHGQQQTLNPNSYFLLFPQKPNSRIIALPAYVGGDVNVAGIKWIGSFPDNVKKGFPRASAVLILNDFESGYPFACLEASIISAARTAGSAVLAAQLLNGGKRSVRSVGIVGTGLIARYVYQFLRASGWELGALHLHDLGPGESERFRDHLPDPSAHPEIRIHAEVSSLMRESELVVLATTAPKPYLTDPALIAHNPIVLNLSLRDVAPALILESFNVVDDVGHVMNAGTSPHLTEQQVGNRDFVTGSLPELIAGRCQVDRSKPIIFSPFGLGVLDLAVGRWVYDRARAENDALEVPDFFFELTR